MTVGALGLFADKAYLSIQLDEDSIFRHKDERRVRTLEEDASSVAESSSATDEVQSEHDLEMSDGDSDNEDDTERTEAAKPGGSLSTVKEDGNTEQGRENVIENNTSDNLCDNKEAVSQEESKKLDPTETKQKSEDNAAEGANGSEHQEAEDAKDSGSSDENEALFPDTCIELQHVKGDT